MATLTNHIGDMGGNLIPSDLKKNVVECMHETPPFARIHAYLCYFICKINYEYYELYILDVDALTDVCSVNRQI